jgi:hypothetical protein
MSLMKKLDFTEEQRRKYRKLKMIVASAGISGLIMSAILYILGYSSISEIIIFLTCAFLIIYVYDRYRKILLKGKSTVAYAEFQKELYAKAFKFFAIFLMPYFFLVVYLMEFQSKLLAENPMLVVLLISFPGIIFGIWAAWYEKKKFGALMRAP